MTLTLQVLPVRQMGAILYSNIVNEELPHSDCGGSKNIEPKFSQGNMDITEYHSLFSCLNKLICLERYYSHASEIPNNYTGDILTPPPNTHSILFC